MPDPEKARAILAFLGMIPKTEENPKNAELAAAFLSRLAERLETINTEDLTPADIARWLEVGIKLERLSRGLPISRVEVIWCPPRPPLADR